MSLAGVLHIGSVSAAAGWEYLTAQVLDESLAYYAGEESLGEAPGRWMAQSELLLGLSGQVTAEEFRKVFVDRVDPRTGLLLASSRRSYRPLRERLAAAFSRLPADALPEERAGLERKVRRSSRVSVDAFDATFSPVKSVSVLWAALDPAGRAAVTAAHREAVRVAVDVLTDRGTFTRTGHHGKGPDGTSTGRFEDADGLVAAGFEHRMSRAGDPQLHTHVVLLNLTRSSSDGKWRTLDSRSLHRSREHAGAVYELAVMNELTRRLGVAWSLRTDGKAYEIDGVSPEALRLFSSRRVAITERLAPLVAEHERVHGRPPNAYELTRMSAWATFQNRPRKQGHESTADAVRRWSAEMAATTAGTLAEVAAHAIPAQPELPLRRLQGEEGLGVEVERQVIAAGLAGVEDKKAVWDRSDLARHISFALASHTHGLTAEQAAAELDRLVDTAIDSQHVARLSPPGLLDLPAELQRRSGESVYVPPGATTHATWARLDFEETLLAASREITPLRARDLVGDVQETFLSTEQQAAVAQILGSGLRLQALVGPAGAGKTTALRALSDKWQAHTGGRLVALAPSQIAAEVLATELAGGHRVLAANTARWAIESLLHPDSWALRAGDLVILDEAGMSSDTHLKLLLNAVRTADARLLLVGDPAQLPSPSAGAGYALVAAQPPAVTLGDVRRFAHGWEAEASLALRQGDHTALDAYDRRARIHPGTRTDLEAEMLRAWSRDLSYGLTSVMVTRSRAEAIALSDQARALRVRTGQVDDTRQIALRDGTWAGTGDMIVTRRNDPHEADGQAINRKRWTITAVDERTISIRPHGDPNAAPTRLSRLYASEHVELGYASSPHGVQGITVDTSHTLIGIDGTDRAGLYVPLTRGRQHNHLYVETRQLDRDGLTLRHEQPLAILARSLDRDTTQTSATTELRTTLAAAESPQALIAVLEDTTRRLDDQTHRTLLRNALPPHVAARIDRDPATPALLTDLHALHLRGHDTDLAVRLAIAERSFTDADSPAQVLRWRLDEPLSTPPPPWRGWVNLTTRVTTGDTSPLSQVALAAAARLDRHDTPADWSDSTMNLGRNDPLTARPGTARPLLQLLYDTAAAGRPAPSEVQLLPPGELTRRIHAARKAVIEAPTFVDRPLWNAHLHDHLSTHPAPRYPDKLEAAASRRAAWWSDAKLLIRDARAAALELRRRTARPRLPIQPGTLSAQRYDNPLQVTYGASRGHRRSM